MENFEEVAEQFEPMISSLLRKLKIYRDFEEFRQIARGALFIAWGRFDATKGNFSSLAYSYMRGAILDHMKEENRYADFTATVEDSTLELMANDSLEEIDHAGLYEALDVLSKEERQLVELLFVRRVSQAECADHFGISVSAVKKRRQRMLGKMREVILEAHGES